jgi:uncharacterized protein YdeI (YjbR/CyaY-like superfamily)
MTTTIQQYLLDGCMRCKLGGSPQCKVNRWREELMYLLEFVKKTQLQLEMKWGVPCFTYKSKNVLTVSALKDFACISFFKGSLLVDSAEKLIQPGPNSQAGRYFRFTSIQEIEENSDLILSYIKEAIELEESGKKVRFSNELPELPIEFERYLDEDPILSNAFHALTPGRQRGYILYFSQPKQEKSRINRIEKCIDLILNGEGLHDAYKKKGD